MAIHTSAPAINQSFKIAKKAKKKHPTIVKVISVKGAHAWVEAKVGNRKITIRKETRNIPAEMLQ